MVFDVVWITSSMNCCDSDGETPSGSDSCSSSSSPALPPYASRERCGDTKRDRSSEANSFTVCSCTSEARAGSKNDAESMNACCEKIHSMWRSTG